MTFTSIVAGFLTLLVLTLALAARAEAFVYWTGFRIPPGSFTEFFTIGRANLDGTGVDQDFITGAYGTGGVAVDAAHVYWANSFSNTIGRANLDGTGVDQRFITGAAGADAPSEAPSGVAVDAAHVYWANSFGGTIGRANLDGTVVDQRFITGADVPIGVAVDAAHVYWTVYWTNTDTNTIGRANLDGTGVDQSFIATPPGQAGAAGVAVDAAHVYWANRDTNTIGRANLDGTGVDQGFIAGAGSPHGVAVDAAHVYWTNHSDSASPAIGRANLDGTGVDKRFITGAGHADGVAVDALRSFSFGNVKKNKKKGTAKLTARVPGPGSLKLAKTKKVERAKKVADADGSVKLPVKSRGNAKKKLNRKGKATVEAKVAYRPQGGDPNIVANTDTQTVKLIKR